MIGIGAADLFSLYLDALNPAKPNHRRQQTQASSATPHGRAANCHRSTGYGTRKWQDCDKCEKQTGLDRASDQSALCVAAHHLEQVAEQSTL